MYNTRPDPMMLRLIAPAERPLLGNSHTFLLSNSHSTGGSTVPLVKVKAKYQVTLPASVREKAGLAVGDRLEASLDGGGRSSSHRRASSTGNWRWRSRSRT